MVAPTPLRDNGQKKVRTVYVSDTSWLGLKNTAVLAGLSVSEWFERLGRSSSPLESPVNPRLESFLKPPIPVFWSLSEAVRRYHLQMGLVEDHRKTSKDYLIKEILEEQEKKLCDCLWRAMVILAVVSYGIPDISINSMTPLLRWVAFRLVQHKAKQADQQTQRADPFIKEADIETDLRKIERALELLRQYSPSYYEFLDMVMLRERMTFIQMARYKRLNTQRNVTETEVRYEVRQALYQLRSYWHSIDEDDVTTVPEKDAYHDLKRRYYRLCAMPTLAPEDRKIMEKDFLLEAIQDPTLEFWMREIDHAAGHRLLTDKSAHTNSSYHGDMHYSIRNILTDRFKEECQEGSITLRCELLAMDKKLMFCKGFADICQVVDVFVKKFSDGSLTLVDIPFADNPLESFKKKMKAKKRSK